MNLTKATRHFEDWLGHHTEVVKKDLHTKHLNMKAGVSPFLCATYWIVRRLSPHCSRIELTTLQIQKDEMRLLHSMGLETANIHLGTASARKPILAHL